MSRPAPPKGETGPPPPGRLRPVGYCSVTMGRPGASHLTITTVGREPRHLGLSGDIDAYTAPDLAAALDGLGPAADVAVDLSGVAFIDSSGLRALVSAHTVLGEHGHRLILVAPSRAASRLFEISGLDEYFHLV